MHAQQHGMRSHMPLRHMRKGQKGHIASISAEGEMGRRLRDMGLIPGMEVQMVGHAPLRDPVALRLCGVTLALRNREADYITVDVTGEDDVAQDASSTAVEGC